MRGPYILLCFASSAIALAGPGYQAVNISAGVKINGEEITSFTKQGWLSLRGAGTDSSTLIGGQWVNGPKYGLSQTNYLNSRGEHLRDATFAPKFSPGLGEPYTLIPSFEFLNGHNFVGLSDTGQVYGSMYFIDPPYRNYAISWNSKTGKFFEYGVPNIRRGSAVVFMDGSDRAYVTNDYELPYSSNATVNVFEKGVLREVVPQAQFMAANDAGTFVTWNNWSQSDFTIHRASGKKNYKMNFYTYSITDDETLVGALVLPGNVVKYGIFKDEKFMDYRDIAPGLPLDLEIRDLKARGDGQIAIVGWRKSASATQVYILKPVPEPATLLTLGLGAWLVARRRRA